MKKIVEENSMPIYKKIESYILDAIKDSRYQQGMMLPSEEEFCTIFNTSRMTVRKALDILVNKGYLHRVKGKGTFVSKFNIEKTMNSISGWQETIEAAGLKGKTEVIKFELDKADEEVAKNLNIVVGSEIYILERLRYADGVPVILEKAHLNAALFPGLLKYDFSKVSLYKKMEEKYGVILDHLYQKLYTRNIVGDHAKKLFGKDEATALIMIDTSYDQHTRPIEYTVCYINGERYTIRYVVKK